MLDAAAGEISNGGASASPGSHIGSAAPRQANTQEQLTVMHGATSCSRFRRPAERRPFSAISLFAGDPALGSALPRPGRILLFRLMRGVVSGLLAFGLALSAFAANPGDGKVENEESDSSPSTAPVVIQPVAPAAAAKPQGPPTDVRVTLKFNNAVPSAVMASIAEQAGIAKWQFKGDNTKRISIDRSDVTISQALAAICAPFGWSVWTSKDGELYVGTSAVLAEQQKAGAVAQIQAGEIPAEAAAEQGPAPEPEEPRVTATFRNAKIEVVLLALSTQANVRISVEGKAVGSRVDQLVVRDVPLSEALDAITQPKGFIWWRKKDGSYGIADKAYYEQTVWPESVIQRIFRPEHISAEDFEKAIKGVLTPKIGKSAIDPRTNKVIVTDLPAVIELITRLLQEIDVQLVTRVFQIRHANVEDVAKQIEDYRSGPGTIKTDPRTHQIIVTDLLQNIKRMEMLIDVLDVGPEIVVYDVNNIGLKGEQLEDLRKVIDSIRTKDLLFETNSKQGTFVLEDVPEVHDKVEKILQAFDQPMKQVQIFAEVLKTNFKTTFNFDMNITWNDNIFTAARDGLVTLPGKPSGNAANSGGYIDLKSEFPTVNSNAGLSITNLTKKTLWTLSTAMSDDSTNVLLQPRLYVKNQEEANINVGSEEPYLTTYFNNYSSSSSNTSFSRETVTTGLEMNIKPSISNNGLVEVEVSIEDSSPVPVTLNAGDLGKIDQIGRKRSKAESVLLIPNGETRMIGGLLSEDRTRNLSGLPWLIRIPIIGPLFGNYDKSNEKKNLLIFITPTIIEERGQVKTTQIGRRGRALAIEDMFEEYTTPTLSGLSAAKNAAQAGEKTGAVSSANSSSLLSGAKPDSELPYLLGHDEYGKRKRSNRTSSYESPVSGPSGALSSASGSSTISGSSEESKSGEPPAPSGEQTRPQRERQDDAQAPPPPPSESETRYNIIRVKQ